MLVPKPIKEARVDLPSGWDVSAMYTLGKTIRMDTPTPFKILPANKPMVDKLRPTNTNPSITRGEQRRKVSLTPINSASFPPRGANIKANIMSMLTSHDFWFSSRPISSKPPRETAPKYATNERDTITKHTLRAPRT